MFKSKKSKQKETEHTKMESNGKEHDSKASLSIDQPNNCPLPSTTSFDFDLVCHQFQLSIEITDSVDLTAYLLAYTELNKFFSFFGRLFVFVSADVVEKINTLKNYQNDSSISNHYQTLQSMIKYEINDNLLNHPKRPSGSRTLLRLHRAMEFIEQFLRDLIEIDDSQSTSGPVQTAYNRTLSRYHPWYIRKLVHVAMYSGLPTRQQLIKQILDSKNSNSTSNHDLNDNGCSDREHVNQRIDQLAHIVQKVYVTTEKLFDSHQLLDLP